MTAVLVAIGTLLGLVVGSFLNVVVWRVPRGQSVSRPRSRCPGCGAPIRPRDNIPLLSWLVLRGRCRDCGGAISLRYPVVELATAVLFGLVSAGVLAGGIAGAGDTGDLPGASSLVVLLALLVLVAVSIALTLVDIEHHRLPDVIVLPAVGAALVLFAVAAALGAGWETWLRALGAGGILFLAYFVMLVIYPRGMGFGDVKLAALLGIYLGWVGWGALVVGGFAAFLLGGLYAVVLLARRKVRRGSGIPFGPWMVLGAWVGIVAGQQAWDGYVGLFA